MPPSLPTAAELLARSRQYVVATEAGTATSYSQVSVSHTNLISRFGSQDDVTFDLRGWKGIFNGGTPSSTGGTDVNNTPLKISANNAGTNKPARPAIIGSLTTTPTDQVGMITNLPTTGTTNRFPTPAKGDLANYLAWAQLKGISTYEAWTGPNLDGNQLDFSYNSTVGAWSNGSSAAGAVVDGVRIHGGADAIQPGTGPASAEIRNCYVTKTGDDAIEADWSNTPLLVYDCLFDDVFAFYSTQGTADRSALTTTIENSIVVIKRRRWHIKTATEAACTYAKYEDDGSYWLTNGVFDKRNGNFSPKLFFKNSLIVIEAVQCGASSCGSAWPLTGFKNATHATAEGSTLLWMRCPNHPSYPVPWDATAYLPGGLALLSYQGNESILTDAVQDWHNRHPQYGLAQTGGGGGTGGSGGTISRVGSFGNLANAASVNVTLASGIADGDAVLTVGECVNTATMSPPAGWSNAPGSPWTQSAGRVYLWTKDVVTAADSGATATFTTSTSNKIVVAGAAYHAAEGFPTSYFDVLTFTPQATASTSFTAAQATATLAGDYGVAAFCTRGADPTGWTPATGLTELQDLEHVSTGATTIHLCDSNGSVGTSGAAWGPFTETNISSDNGGMLTLLLKANTSTGGGSGAGGARMESVGLIGSIGAATATPATVGTQPSRVMGGGFQNTGTMAPLGVGHNWYAASGADVAGVHVTTDGVTWKPANGGLAFGQHRIIAIEGSRTVANRLWALASASADGTGTGAGRLLQGAYSPTSGTVTWTQVATLSGAAGGGSSRPRQTGRLLALDEANDTLYCGSINGVYRVTISTATATQRALAGSKINGIVLDPADPTLGYATADAAGTAPGVHRLTNLRTGTVADTVYTTLTDPHDLVVVSGGGGTTYLYVAAMTQGPRRWTVSADITTGWTSLAGGYNLGGNGCAYIDVFRVGTVDRLLCGNAGDVSMTSAASYSTDAGTTWVDETAWTVSYVPAGETQTWWEPALNNRAMLDGNTFDAATVRFDPADVQRAFIWGRAGIWSGTGGTSWQPTVRGLCVTVGHTVAADPTSPSRAVVGDGDWTFLSSPSSFVSGMPTASQPSTGVGQGLAFRGDTGKLALATDDGEVWTTTTPFAATPTWVSNGFGSVSTAARAGAVIGQNASGTEVLLTMRVGGGIERKLGTATPAIVSTLDTAATSMTTHFCWPQGHTGRAYVYCSTGSGLLRSSDHGATWTRIVTYSNPSEYTGTIHVDPTNPDTLYLTRDDGTAGGTGLFKITSASGTPVSTQIGPTVTQPGPCAVHPSTGVVYLATRGSDTGGTKLYASPSANPDASTTFVDVTDAQWAAGPFEPADMCVLGDGTILVANKQGGYFTATR